MVDGGNAGKGKAKRRGDEGRSGLRCVICQKLGGRGCPTGS